MSKLIESLKAGAKEFSKTKNGAPESTRGSSHEMTQAQLADIYFSSGEKTKKSEYPMVVKVIEKQKAISVLPWIIASLAFLITAFALFSTKRIFIDIKVIDDNSPYLSGEMVPGGPRLQSPPKENLGGERVGMQAFIFQGAAKVRSAKSKSSLTLINSSIASFARANLYFKEPVDLMSSKLVFWVRGEKGGENIGIALRDNENIQAFDKGSHYPFPSGLSSSWQRVEMSLSEVAKAFNARAVTGMRFEFGSKEAKNKPGDTIHIRDLQIVPL